MNNENFDSNYSKLEFTKENFDFLKSEVKKYLDQANWYGEKVIELQDCLINMKGGINES